MLLTPTLEIGSESINNFKPYDKANASNELFCLRQTHMDTFRNTTKMKNKRMKFIRKPESNTEQRFNENIRIGRYRTRRAGDFENIAAIQFSGLNNERLLSAGSHSKRHSPTNFSK